MSQGRILQYFNIVR